METFKWKFYKHACFQNQINQKEISPMTIDEIKAFCYDHEEAGYAKAQYLNLVKHGAEFWVHFTGKNQVGYSQKFDKNGIPIGNLTDYVYDEFEIDLEDFE